MRINEPEDDVLASVMVIRTVVIRVTARLTLRDVLHSQGPTNQNLRLGSRRLPLERLAIPACEIRFWVVIRIPCNCNADCAYGNDFPVKTDGLVVFVPRTLHKWQYVLCMIRLTFGI